MRFFILLSLLSLTLATTPDRQKRCDWDQIPACTACEGIGGIITGDDLSQIKFTSCEIISLPSSNNTGVPVPLYPKQFTNHIDGILVSPFNESNPHIYVPQTSTWYFDSPNHQLRFDNNVEVLGINTTAAATHRDQTFYILPNGFPICICQNLGINPLRYDAFADAIYLGRESLGVEYLWTTMVLDHFVKGPHHIWMDPATGLPVRAWQPFNGLQVYSQWTLSVDPEKFVIPASCNVGVGIGCTNSTSSVAMSPITYQSHVAAIMQTFTQ